MRGRRGCLSGCFTNLLLLVVCGLVLGYGLMVALNPWALHIGGRSTPLLYWHGTGTVVSKDGKSYPLYVSYWPSRPGKHNGGRREGKGWSADLDGSGWICLAPGSIEKLQIVGTLYGGYSSDADSLIEFRLLEWRKYFSIDPPHRGFFEVAGTWQNGNLVMTRPNEQGIKLNSGAFIDNATVTLHPANYDEFESTCRSFAPVVKAR